LRLSDSARDFLFDKEDLLLKILVLILTIAAAFSVGAQTNYVYVVNDDSAECMTNFDAGLGCGAMIAAGLFVLWMIRVIPGGSDAE
jgi:hypothetical protein